MSNPRLNVHLFSEVDIQTVSESLTGVTMDDWPLPGMLETAGLSFSVRDPIDVTVFNLLSERVHAAFLAGYLIGRNPDLLLLQNIGSFFQSEGQS